jgi:hypothetical protein
MKKTTWKRKDGPNQHPAGKDTTLRTQSKETTLKIVFQMWLGLPIHKTIAIGRGKMLLKKKKKKKKKKNYEFECL